MIERAGNHGQASARLLVKRPEAEIIVLEITQQGLHGTGEECLCRLVSRCEEVVVNSPRGPDEPVENVGGRGDDVLLEPEIAAIASERNAAFAYRSKEAREC